MASLCFITTCRSRLEHLRQSLPRLATQPDTACVVVDYGCPEKAGDWVEAHHPGVRVVRAGDQPKFEPCRSRNLGAAAATEPWLCFVDADTLLAPEFAQTVLPLLQPGHFYRPEPRVGDSAGLHICHRSDFDRVGGYDEVLQDWGMNDRDLFRRLEMAGVEMAGFPGSLVGVIAHSIEKRVEHYEVKSPELSSTLNLVYCTAKWDLMRLTGGTLDLEQRGTLYQQVRAAVLDAHHKGTSMNLQVPVTVRKTLSGAALQSQLVYRLGKTTDEAGQPLRQQRGHLREAADRE
jgi:hypothetical protein